MSDFTIIQTGGKQYKVSSGQKIRVEKLPGEAGAAVVFDKVLLRSAGGTVTVGMPYLAGTVTGTIAGQVRGEKKIVFKYHSKTRQRKKKGHRQNHTEVTIG